MFYITYILIGIILFNIVSLLSPVDISGAVRSLDYARQKSSLSSDDKIIHTEKLEDRYIDFALDSDGGFIVNVLKRKSNIAGIYFDDIGYHRIDNAYETVEIYTERFNQSGNINWISALGVFSKSKYANVYWTILDKSCQIDEDASSYDFTVDDKECVLYIKIIPKK